jgi:hypothetical protein
MLNEILNLVMMVFIKNETLFSLYKSYVFHTALH